MGDAHTVQDTFASWNASAWAVMDGSTPTINAGAATSAYAILRSVTLVNLQNSQCYVGDITLLGAGNAGVYFWLGTTFGDGYFRIYVDELDDIYAGESWVGVTYRANAPGVSTGGYLRVIQLVNEVKFQYCLPANDPLVEASWVTVYTFTAGNSDPINGYGGFNVTNAEVDGYNVNAGAIGGGGGSGRVNYYHRLMAA